MKLLRFELQGDLKLEDDSAGTEPNCSSSCAVEIRSIAFLRDQDRTRRNFAVTTMFSRRRRPQLNTRALDCGEHREHAGDIKAADLEVAGRQRAEKEI